MNKNGWTGGQYSLFRAVFGVYLVVHFFRLLSRDLTSPLTAPTFFAVACSLLFLVGFLTRGATLIVAAAGILLHQSWIPAVPLILTCFIPADPYGSIAARHRSDPGGRWRMPRYVLLASRVALAGVYIFVGAALVMKWPFAGAIPGLVALHVLSYDPGWIAALPALAPERIFYDGSCGLCHAAVRFVLAEDRTGNAFRFAPLSSSVFQTELPDPRGRSNLPDSLVVLTEHRRVLVRSAAVLHICRRLGGFWAGLANAAGNLPSDALDWLYDLVAKIRHRIFVEPEEQCPILPEALRARFDR